MFRASPQVEAVYTKAQLAKVPVPAGRPDAWTLEQRARASFDAERSGDLVVFFKKGVSLISKPEPGDVATHGSPWDYDRRVPILFWRPGMTPSDRPDPIDTSNIMPTLAAMIGVSLDPSAIDGRCLQGISGVICPNR